jgi:hypothetical protein
LRKIQIIFLAVTLAACTLPWDSKEDGSASPTPLPSRHTPTLTATQTPRATAGYTQCAWTWATQPLPELSIQLQTALDAAGLQGVSGTAEAYGENCIVAPGKVDHFAVMETDFRIHAEVPNLADTAALGDLLERILVVLDSFPPGSTPGPQPGYIGVRFTQGSQEFYLWFTVSVAKTAREGSLHGAALLEELQNK